MVYWGDKLKPHFPGRQTFDQEIESHLGTWAYLQVVSLPVRLLGQQRREYASSSHVPGVVTINQSPYRSCFRSH